MRTLTDDSKNDEQEQIEFKKCEDYCKELRVRLKSIRDKSNPTILKQISANSNTKDFETCTPKLVDTCTGHYGKCYSVNWSHDSNYILTSAQDGKLIIWNAITGSKLCAVTLKSARVMNAAFSPNSNTVASGGLDATVTVHKFTPNNDENNVNIFDTSNELAELQKHEAYLAHIRYIDNNRLLSASGDGTILLWDIEHKTPIQVFTSHTSDVECIDVNKGNENIFVSSSCDGTARIWDIRVNSNMNNQSDNDNDNQINEHSCVQTFEVGDSSVTSVRWFANNESIITGSDDGFVKMFDERSCLQMNEYIEMDNYSMDSQDIACVTSVDVSLNGQYIFAAFDNGYCFVWNSLNAKRIADMKHGNRVQDLEVSPNGYAIATVGWDYNLRIFA